MTVQHSNAAQCSYRHVQTFGDGSFVNLINNLMERCCAVRDRAYRMQTMMRLRVPMAPAD